MSFLFKNTHTNLKIKFYRGKEHDSFLAHHPKQISHNSLERASAFTSKGSLTIEASLAAPIFLLGVLCLVYLLEMIAIQTTIRSALQDVGREMAKEVYLNPIVSTGKMERELVKIIGEDWFDNSIVAGGSKGMDCSKSRISRKTSVLELSVQYKLKIPVLMFRIPLLSREETIRVKGWTGYTGGGFGNPHEDTVYITETGVVYHKNPDCTYLELSVQMVNKNDLTHLRNEGGGKYYPCERCAWGNRNNVYITHTGNKYHNSITCSGLKRSVYAVPISEIYGRGGCSRCVK